MRSQWEQILGDGYLDSSYTIEYTRSSEGGPDSARDGNYHLRVSGGVVASCRYTPSSNAASSDPCEELRGTTYSPVDHFYTQIAEFGREQVAVKFDLDIPIPTLIRYDRGDTTGEEFTIRVTWFEPNG